jgi:hypothetical protein
VVFGRRTGAIDEVDNTILSCPCPDVQRTTRADCPLSRVVASDTLHNERPSMGFLDPTTLEVAGSDLHRDCLARLCSTFRLSQPPGASFRLHRPALFHAGSAPGLQTFRGFPSPVARIASRHSCPSCCFSSRSLHQRADEADAPPQLQGFAHPESPYRWSRCYPKSTDRSSRSLRPCRGTYPSGLDLVLPRSLLSWAFTPRWTASRPSRRWLCRVSKNQRTG